jgi:hypothetical protein
MTETRKPHRRPAPPPGSRTGAPLLQVRDLEAWYGESHVLHGISFDVKRARSSRFWAATAPARPRR